MYSEFRPVECDLDLAQTLSECRLLCIGDWHVGYSVKRELVRVMPELKRSNLNAISFELLHANMQEDLDFYQGLTPKCDSHERRSLIKHFVQIWGNDEDPAEKKQLEAMAEQFVSMIDVMTENGIRVIGIEPPVPRMFAAGTKIEDADRFGEWRDECWIEATEKALSTCDRVLVFAGFRHFGYAGGLKPSTFNEHMQVRGHQTRVIQYAGGDYPLKMIDEEVSTYEMPESIGQRLTKWANENDWGNRRFHLNLQSEKPRDGDYVLHLPYEVSAFNDQFESLL